MHQPMMTFSRSSIFAAVLLHLAIYRNTRTSAAISIEASAPRERQNKEWQCSLYLAESIIPGAGLGVFTSREYNAGDDLQIPAEITVPMGTNGEDEAMVMGSLRHYHWDTQVGDHHLNQQQEGTDWYDFAFGAGALPNHDVYYANIHHSERDLEGPLVDAYHRANPGTDAYSPFHHLALGATKPIQAGGELFLNYGQAYFNYRNYGVYLRVPNRDSYNTAARLMRQFVFKKEEAGETQQRKLMDDEVVNGNTSSGKNTAEKDAVLKSNQSKWDAVIASADVRTRSALPKDVDNVLKSNGKDFALASAVRSNEWLAENGRCLDTFRIQASGIFEAGRGGFANGAIFEGDVIAPFPVAQVNRTTQMLESDKNDEFPSHRLLLNYCISHPESTLMLCPYTSTMIFNHASPTPRGSGAGKVNAISKPNAKIQLSSWGRYNEDLLKMTPHEILSMETTLGVLYDIVATRHIAPDEEIFLDYGGAWQETWDAHVENWRPFVTDLHFEDGILDTLIEMEACGPDGLDYYNVGFDTEDAEAAFTLIPECIANHTRTHEMILNPPSVHDTAAISGAPSDYTVTTGCFYLPYWDTVADVNVTSGNIADHEQKIAPWSYATEQGTTGGLFPCQLLVQEKKYVNNEEDEQEHDQLHYTVLVFLDHDEEGWDQATTQIQLVRNVPQRAIRHITQEWRNQPVVDHHSSLPVDKKTPPAPFRHYIQVSDDAFPLAWRNLANTSTSTATATLDLNIDSSPSYELKNALGCGTGVPITMDEECF